MRKEQRVDFALPIAFIFLIKEEKMKEGIKYSVTFPEELRLCCIRNEWFTEGTNGQYDKLFYANEHGAPIEEIATIIWVCSAEAWCRRDILAILEEEKKRYDEIMGYVKGGEKSV